MGVEDWVCDVLQSEYITYIEIKKELTHCNVIDIRFPSFVVILIQGPFTNGEGSADCNAELG